MSYITFETFDDSEIDLDPAEEALLRRLGLIDSCDDLKRNAADEVRWHANYLARVLARNHTLPAALSEFTAADIGPMLVLAQRLEDL